MAQTTQTGTDLAAIDETFRGVERVSTFADALALFSEAGFDVNDNVADGIRSLDIVDSKDRLIGVPFLLLRWRFNDGQHGMFVSAEIMLQDETILVLNDGSTGIRAQLWELTEHRQAAKHPSPYAGRMVRKGLRRSDYTYTDVADGKEKTASTYYLDF